MATTTDDPAAESGAFALDEHQPSTLDALRATLYPPGGDLGALPALARPPGARRRSSACARTASSTATTSPT